MPRTANDAATQTPLNRGVIAVIRVDNSAHALTLGRGLARSGVAGIEVTMTVPDAVGVIAALSADGLERVGAGTVRTLDQAKACIDSGAQFLVSPHTDPALIELAVSSGIAVIPGALTPSEVLRANALGASAVKIFPVSAVGGVEYIRALLEPLPDIRVVVSGEVSLPEVFDYLAVGAWATCIGGSLWRRPDVEAGDVDAVQIFATQELTRLGLTNT
jgi:2-dehydro-3-deoxyphosphogluconate aldolase/(4S)-4-hydroxy-2-oxoglutarate aldolase